MNILSAIFNPPSSTEKMAVFGDIHSNLEALDAVLADMKQLGATRFICTGDTVGYGADPNACIQRLRDLDALTVKGNHDVYCAEKNIPDDVNPTARDTITWTKNQLSAANNLWLLDLPMQQTATDIAITHSSFEPHKRWPYISQANDAKPSLLRQSAPLAFYGHTHRPIVFALTPSRKTQQFTFNKHRIKKGQKAFINPGSVGQPRDGDPRAAYALYDPSTQTAWLRRVEYDIETAASKIRKAELPARNADRLFLGK